MSLARLPTALRRLHARAAALAPSRHHLRAPAAAALSTTAARYVAPPSSLSLSLAGKVIAVTGSTQGLGAAIVRAAVALGAEGVVIHGRDTGKESCVALERHAREAGCHALVVAADLQVEADCRRIIHAAADEFGRIDGLVNSAGCTFRGGLDNTDGPLWDTIFNVNARAPFFTTQEAVKLMRATGVRGSIVNVSSKSAYGGQTFLTPYCASKAALDCVTKNTAQAVKADGIRVNSIQLGWCHTDQEHVVQLEETGDALWREHAEEGMAVGRMLVPGDAAALAAFLLSDASVMITGGLHDIFPEEEVRGCYA